MMEVETRPISVNPDSMLLMRAWQRFWVFSWDATRRLQAPLVIAYFYIFSAMLFIYLELTLPPSVNFGLRQIQTSWGIPSVIVIGIYAIFGVMMAQPNQKPIVYFMLLLPSVFYSVALAQISLDGNALAWTAFIYTTSFTGLAIVTIHQRWQIGQVNRQTFHDAGSTIVLEKQVREILNHRTQKDQAYQSLQELFIRMTDNGDKALTQDGVNLVLSYMSIFIDVPQRGKYANSNANTADITNGATNANAS